MKTYLEEEGRVSLRALRLEFELDDERLAGLVDELVEVQRVAVREGEDLVLSDSHSLESRRERVPRPYTPKHLADKILRSRSALEGERKQVTVLFADVKGSTDLAGELDPEEWHAILDRFFRILAEGVHRFEGTVNQYTGDGIMALFGAPVAYEDHAQRACYAALHLCDELRRYADELRLGRGLSFSTRVGLNSGEVVVGSIGDDLRMDYTAQGQVVNIAQRMEQLAEPGSAYLTQNTADRVAGFFELREIGPTALKGPSEPVRVYELRGAGEFRSRFDVSRARGLSKFVGRESEMAILESALERALAGAGQIVGIVAEAGTGKSRLTWEFAEACRSRGIRVVSAACPPHGTAIPLGLSMSIQRAYQGIADDDTAETARDKIAAGLSRRDPGLVEFIPFLMEFLGVAEPGRAPRFSDPEARRHEFVRYIERLLELGDTAGVVTVMEDLHWIDATSQEASLEIHRLERTRPYLTIMNFRPEYQPPEADWPNYEEIRLRPLPAESTRALLRSLLGPEPEVALEERIQERAGGNPFFVEEIVQALADSGVLDGARGSYRQTRPVEDIEVPSSVQEVLAARIDSLEEHTKRALRAAAVAGLEFPLRLVGVSGLDSGTLTAAMQQLTDADFVYQTGAYPELEYAFKHPLTRQVAYDTQLVGQRQVAHAKVARLLEERYADRLDEKAALLAHHFELAGESLDAARWTLRAAEQVAWSDATAQLEQWRRLRELATAAGSSAEARSLRLTGCMGVLLSAVEVGTSRLEAASVFEEGRSLARQDGNRRAEVRLIACYAEVVSGLGYPESALDLMEEASRIADEGEDRALLLLVGRGANVVFAHDAERGLKLTDRAIEAAGELGELPVGSPEHQSLAMVRRLKGLILGLMGQYERSTKLLSRVHDAAERSGYLDLAARSLVNLAQVAARRGNSDEALALAQRGLELGERIHSANALAAAHYALGNALLQKREWQGARDAFERVLDISADHKVAVGRSGAAYAPFAEACLALGDREGAEAALEEGLRRLRGAQRVSLAFVRVRLLDARGELREIDRVLKEAAEMIDRTGWETLRPRLHEERARLAALQGDEAAAYRELREAHRLYCETGADGHAARLAKELA